MMLDSKRFDVWRRLGVRYDLEDQPPGGLGVGVSKGIYLISDADALLRTPLASITDTTYTAALSGQLVVATVPTGRRWRVLVLDIARTGGDNQWDTVRLLDASNSLEVILDRTANQSTQSFGVFGQPLFLDEEDSITVYLDGTGSAGGTIRCSVWVEEEDAY